MKQIAGLLHRHASKLSRATITPKMEANRETFIEFAKLISINVNGFRTREAEVRKFIENQGSNCVLALSDTRLRRGVNVNVIPGYSMIRQDKETNGIMATAGGVALIIPKGWASIRVPLTTVGDQFDAIAAILPPPDNNTRPFKLLCIYNRPGNHFPAPILAEFKDLQFNGREIGGILVGDMNCPHAAFGSRTTNEFGTRFLQLLNQEELIYFHADSPTYYSNATGLSNTLDLVISDPEGSRLVQSCHVRGDVGSDHLPVITTLSFHKTTKEKQKTNINIWAQTIDRMLEHYTFSDDIDENIENLSRLLMEAKSQCTTTVTSKRRLLPYEIRQSIRIRKTLMKYRKRAGSELVRKVLTTQYNRINKKIHQQIKELDEKETERLCENICTADNSYIMWKHFNRYKAGSREITEPDAPLQTPDGNMTANDKEKCDEFARYLHSVHQTPDDPFFDNDFKKAIDNEINGELRDIRGNTIPKIGIKDLDELLSATKSSSAPGNDGVSYGVMKLLSNSSKKIICDLINLCLLQNVFPKAWKEAKVTMVPKPGRDKKLAANYRPISLLSCIGKLYERYIYKYLLQELHSKNFINPHQAGFTRGRSTQEHLFRLAQTISNGFKRRDCTLAIFLDVKVAFDSVWKNGLKHKINKIGLSKQMENILHSFLDNRALKVCTEGVWSEIVELRAGTPQGSSISPILYLIFVNDLVDYLNTAQLLASQFADDIGLWATKATVHDARETIQNGIKAIEEWCKKWHVTLSPIKSKLLLFSKCPRHKEELSGGSVTIQLFGEPVTSVNEAEFLGVTFDSRLTWEPQTRKVVAKSYKRLNLLRAISSLSDTINPNTMLDLYKSIIRSLFEYCSLCILNAAETHIQKLQLIQNESMRIISKFLAYVAIEDLHDCCGLSYVKEYLTECARKKLAFIKKASPLVGDVIAEYNQVKYIKENASILDILGD